MTILGGRGGIRPWPLAALMTVSAVAHAACNGPQNLVAQMRAQPTAEKAVLLGSWYASHQQFQCAVETFQIGLKIDSTSAQLHYLTGLALTALRQFDEAVPELRTSAELAPQVLKPHLVLASVYEELDKSADAETEWRKALQIDPHSETALEGLSALLLNQKDYPAVVELLKGAPPTERITVLLAKALEMMGYVERAEAVLQEGLDKNPNSMALAEGMRAVLVKENKYDEAVKLEQRVAAVHPNDLNAQQALFEVLILSNRFDEARTLGPKLLAARPRDPHVLYLNGALQHATGNDMEAKRLLERAVALQPDFYDSRYYLGLVLVVLREWQEAKVNLEKAIELGASRPGVHFELAKALRGLGENQKAGEELKKFQEMKRADDVQSQADGVATQGDKELAQGNIKAAVDRYREAVESLPANANYRFKLAAALDQAGDAAAAREQLEESLRLDPKLASAQDLLGYMLSREGDAEGAVQHFRKAVEAAPRWPEAWINFAAELAITGRVDEAKQAVAKALELDPQNTQAKELSEQLARTPQVQPNLP